MDQDFCTTVRRLFRILFVVIGFSVFFASLSRSQSGNINSHASLAEKIYLQLDGKVYTTDKTIWFKAIVTDAVSHIPTALSGVLYVELVGPDEKITEKKLIKLVNGIGDGFFQLNTGYSEGIYQIRGYTEWNKNFGTDFIFNEYIRIFAAAATLKSKPKNGFPPAENRNEPDLQFFAESGELVHGIPCKIGFKALDHYGKGISVAGEIVTKEGEVVTFFKSNQLGMGSFKLSMVDSTYVYYAKLKSPSEENLSLMYPLPRVVPRGNVLAVIKNGDEIRLAATSNYLKDDTVYVRISCRGMVYFDIKGGLKEGVLAFHFPANRLPEGIIAFTMMDNTFQPIAERLYFNERPDSRINISISTDKVNYTQRELTQLKIGTENSNGEAVPASLSLLVLNKEQMGHIQQTRQNILSYFLLSSDLKGEIEDPGFYFNNGDNKYNDLDALLLTQGWRKYNYTKPAEKILFQPEGQLIVSGSVHGLFKKKKKEVKLTMISFGQGKSIQTQNTDSLGRFNFNMEDEFGQNLNILIQSANKSGTKKNYTIALDKKESPAVYFDQTQLVESVDSVLLNIVEKNLERKKVDETFPISSGGILLDEVVVEGYRLTPERKKVMDEYGKPKVVIEGEAIQKKEEKWSYGLYSVLLFNFPDKVIIKAGRDGNLYAKVKNSEMTLVVIDGKPVIYYEYPFIPNIPPSQVKSFEIIEGARNFSKLYLEAYPQANPMDAPAWGDVIAIYTHGGKGIYGTDEPVGLLHAAIPVFSASREFYAPKYENLQPQDWYKPDLRALVHWIPKINANHLGKASATFYNADITGEMMVVVEAISENGEIGYKEVVYEVKKRN